MYTVYTVSCTAVQLTDLTISEELVELTGIR
jgi:hypothetical protein